MIDAVTGCWDDQLLCDEFLGLFCNIWTAWRGMEHHGKGDAQLARRHHCVLGNFAFWGLSTALGVL